MTRAEVVRLRDRAAIAGLAAPPYPADEMADAIVALADELIALRDAGERCELCPEWATVRGHELEEPDPRADRDEWLYRCDAHAEGLRAPERLRR